MPSPFATAPVTVVGDRAVEEPVRLRVAQSREAAQLQLQIQQLEEQIRALTGQVEGLQFQMTQMQTLIERTNEDNEFRFQALEGGGPGKPPAATESGGAMPAEELPQNPASVEEAPALPDESRLEPGDGEPMHTIGDSQDPMIGNAGADGTLGTLSDDGPDVLDGSRPLDLSLGSGTELSNGDAQAQYAAGYEAIVRGDYAFAEDQFQQFVALYPDDPQAPDATHWLGEALIQRGAYDDAALVLAEGYQQYQNSSRAPDLLLKLGIALNGAGEAEVACRTFATLEQRHTEVADAFRQRLNEEKQRAQCPG
jgi:tol-pal system protein YbgF